MTEADLSKTGRNRLAILKVDAVSKNLAANLPNIYFLKAQAF
jgi:hypothetical protein